MKLGVLRSSDYVYDSRMNTVDWRSASLMSGTVCSSAWCSHQQVDKVLRMCMHASGHYFKYLLWACCEYPYSPIMTELYGTTRTIRHWTNTVSNATSTKSNRFSGTLHVSPVCRDFRRTSGVAAMLKKLQWDSLQQRRAELPVPWCLPNRKLSRRHTLNQFRSAPEGSKRDMCTFGAMQAHTVRPSFQVQPGCGTLCQ